LSSVVRVLPSGAPPALLEGVPAASPELRRFADSERARWRTRAARLSEGSALRSYEVEYGLELGSEVDGTTPLWRGPHALDAYPASVRSRRIAVAIRCGRRDLLPELARAARAVAAQVELHLLANHVLENAIGLVCAASVTRGAEAELWWKLGAALLNWQLGRQFLADGGHFELSASYHLSLTAALLEAIELAGATQRPVPDSWRTTAQRALDWALQVRAPDGTYPLLNDAALDSAPAIDDVLALGRACGMSAPGDTESKRGTWLHHLPDTGWLLAGADDGAWLCVDAAADGAPYQPGHVHADALTFELWVEGRRAIVDYGVSSYAVDEARAETRSTRSHNTVELDGLDSCEVWHAFRVGRRSRARVSSLAREKDAVAMEVEHDGYAWLPGKPVHRRRLSFGPGALRIADEVAGRGVHSGISRLRLDATASGRLEVRGSSEPVCHADVWHPRFAEPLEAAVHEQPVSNERTCDWTVSWRSR
jgi:hypothetical protein